LLFFWVSKRKEGSKTQKKFISPIEAMNGSANPLLSEEGINAAAFLLSRKNFSLPESRQAKEAK
ncbi:MAG: hypothetical protein IJR52_04450, partial [Selenomonadaceae bacterium]|nr:hypothetical protein [Selenomonadaceae bacterium]